MQPDTNELQLGSNLGKVESYVESYYGEGLTNAERIKTALGIQRILPLLSDDEKGQLRVILDKKSEQLNSEGAKEIQPLDSAIGWAPTRANLRAVETARSNKVKDEGDINAHEKNKPEISRLLEEAKARRDEKETKSEILTEIPVIPDKIDQPESETVVSDKIDAPVTEAIADVVKEKTPAPSMLDIDSSPVSNNQTVQIASGEEPTGANRGLELLTNSDDGDANMAPSAVDTSLPAKSIQAENSQAPVATIESAKSDGGPVEIEKVVTIEPKPEVSPIIPAVAEPIPPVTPSAETTTPPSAPPAETTAIPVAQATIPASPVPQVPKLRRFFDLFNNKGPAVTTNFEEAQLLALERAKKVVPPAVPPEEQLKNAA